MIKNLVSYFIITCLFSSIIIGYYIPKIENYEEQFLFLKAKINEYKTKIENYEKQISELKMKVLSLQFQTLYSNPIYKEAKDFINEDKTNENKYVPNEYICIDFAKDVNNNAEKKGIRTALVIIYF
jgi:hypothetical protein